MSRRTHDREALRWIDRIANKPLDAYYAGVRQAREHGYRVWEEWATPRISSRHYQLKMSPHFPDARRISLSLRRTETGEPVGKASAYDLRAAFALAVAWLDEVERRESSRTRAFHARALHAVPTLSQPSQTSR